MDYTRMGQVLRLSTDVLVSTIALAEDERSGARVGVCVGEWLTLGKDHGITQK